MRGSPTRWAALGTLLIAALWQTGPVAAQETHSAHCLAGCPAGAPPSNDLLVRPIYILSSNDHTKFADWAAYRVTEGTIGPSQSRSWRADPWLAESETLEPADYEDAHADLHTDRGHQVPLAAFSGTGHWRETNYLSNITPQKSALNQGAWNRLEGAVRALARDEEVDSVYVMTGPLYERSMAPLPGADEAHTVPSGYWKIIGLVNDDGAIELAAFVFEQGTARGADFCDHTTTVDVIEMRAGLEFFHGLSAGDQEALESTEGTLSSELGCAD